ncbi:MAG TPA: hypothetical protein VJ770_01285 [Stellaceae bacterium]|nr:hypothetical protein [Stellaceae bacterium]
MTSGSMTEAYTAVTPRQEHLGLPSGPYLLSCTNAHMSGGTLVATCDNQASASEHTMDRWRLAELPNAGQCNGAIENFNGRLVCGTEPMVGSSTPPQSYGSAFGGSAETPPYEGEGYGSNSAYPAGYPHGQPVAPAVKPLVGSSMAPQSYDSSSGTSTHIGQPYPGYGTWRTPTYQPMPQAYPSGYPQGQPVAPAAKPYYSQPY